MPFDNNLTLINGVVLTTTTDAVATTTSYHATNRCRILDLGASIISGSPEGTGVNGISVALICTTTADAGTLAAYIQASDSSTFTGTDAVTIGTFEGSTTTGISYTLVPFHYVIRVQTEKRYIRAHLTLSESATWTTVWVVVGTHHLERL